MAKSWKRQTRGPTRRAAGTGALSAAARRVIALIPDWLVTLDLHYLSSDDRRSAVEGLDRTLADLRQRLGGRAALGAAFVAAHAPSVRLLLHGLREAAEVAALFPRRKNAPPIDVVALVRRRGARAAAVTLARRHGLGVFDRLNAGASQPEIRALLDLPPRRARRRPKGSTSKDLEAYAIAELHKGLAVPRAAILRALWRNPKSTTGRYGERSETADSKWFRRRLQRGIALRDRARAKDLHLPRAPGQQPPTATALSSPEALTIIFFDGYLRDLPAHAPLDTLSRTLVDAIPAGRRKRLAGNALYRRRAPAAAHAIVMSMGWLGWLLFSVAAPVCAVCLVGLMLLPMATDEAAAVRGSLAEAIRDRLASGRPPHRRPSFGGVLQFR